MIENHASWYCLPYNYFPSLEVDVVFHLRIAPELLWRRRLIVVIGQQRKLTDNERIMTISDKTECSPSAKADPLFRCEGHIRSGKLEMKNR